MDRAYYTSGNKQNKKQKTLHRLLRNADWSQQRTERWHGREGPLRSAGPLGTRKTRLPKVRLVPLRRVMLDSEFLCAMYEILLV